MVPVAWTGCCCRLLELSLPIICRSGGGFGAPTERHQAAGLLGNSVTLPRNQNCIGEALVQLLMYPGDYYVTMQYLHLA
jgi:hypothetical protein